MATYSTAAKTTEQKMADGKTIIDAGGTGSLSGAFSGAATGAQLGGLPGALVGAAIGAVSGGVMGQEAAAAEVRKKDEAKQAEAKAAMMANVDTVANTKATSAASPTLGIGGAPLTSGGTAAKYTTGAGALPYDSWNARVYGG
jgi:uncharacterized membrane protein